MSISKSINTKKQPRDYGSGGISERSDGRWMARINAGVSADGKRKVKTIYGKSKTEVIKKLKAFKESPENQISSENFDTSFEEYIRNWLFVFKKNAIKPSTYDRLDNIITHYIAKYLGHISLGNITSGDVQHMVNDIVKRGKSFGTVKKVYDTCCGCFKSAIIRGDIVVNPMLAVSVPSQANFDKKTIRVFTESEEFCILQELSKKTSSTNKNVYNYADVYILILNTGMRCGEAIALDWDDIDFDKKTLWVHKNAVYIKNRDANGKSVNTTTLTIQPTPKTTSGNRIIPLNKAAMSALSNLKNKSDSSGCNCKYVISTSANKRTTYSVLVKQFKRMLGNAGIESAGIHSLRHTFATRLFEKGADVKTVSVILGHSSTAITYSTYIHVIQSKREDAVGLLDNGIDGENFKMDYNFLMACKMGHVDLQRADDISNQIKSDTRRRLCSNSFDCRIIAPVLDYAEKMALQNSTSLDTELNLCLNDRNLIAKFIKEYIN